jgi:hypothetical protein
MYYTPKQIQSDTGLALSMRGEIDGHVGEIVGFVRYRNQDEEDPWVWEEWCFKSGGINYWLEYDPEVKTFGFHEPVAGPQLAKPESGTSSLEVPGLGKLKIDEAGGAYLEEWYGQIPWPAKSGESLDYVDGHIGQEHYSIEWSDETEYFKTKHISKKALRAGFGLPANFFAKSLAESAGKGEGWTHLWKSILIAFVVCIGLAIYAGVSGREIYREQISVCLEESSPENSCLGTTLPRGPITLARVGRVHKIVVRAEDASEQNWHSLYVNLVDEEGTPISGFGGDFWSEYWQEGGESGIESNLSSKRLFKLTQAGQYYIDVEGELEKGSRGPLNFGIYIYEDVLLARYFLILAGVLGLLLVIKHRLYKILS